MTSSTMQLLSLLCIFAGGALGGYLGVRLAAHVSSPSWWRRVFRLCSDISPPSDEGHEKQGGSPYRAAPAGDAGPESQQKAKPPDPNYDNQGRRRWRGPKHFVCTACGWHSDVTVPRIVFCHPKTATGCPQEESGPHLHVTCNNCGGQALMGVMNPKDVGLKDE